MAEVIDVRKGGPLRSELSEVAAGIVACRRCPRLVAYREAVALEPPRRFRGQVYWALPLPGFGDPEARILVVGLAPAAHGGNRTGRFFTGDSSGDTLFAALHRAGLASQPTSVSVDDGLHLTGVFVTAGVRCAPPDNRPTPEEFAACRGHLVAEMRALPRVRAVVALGALAFESYLKAREEAGGTGLRPRPRFAHGAEARLPGGEVLLGSYHVSRQNTNTGRLTPRMLDDVLARAREVAASRA